MGPFHNKLHNGLYDPAAAMRADPDFQRDPQVREERLDGVRPTDRDVAMGIEFKSTADGRLAAKQARPWIE